MTPEQPVMGIPVAPPAPPPPQPKVAAREPDGLDRLGEQLADRVNPIVVKEVRQGLRTRVFWIFFALMLFACITISLVAFAASDGFGTEGKYYAFAFYFCLGVVQFFIIPYTAYRSMAREREDETWVLLTLTGLGPRKILRGKMSSFMLQGSLYVSAAAPFLLFSYYLNGVDLPSLISVLLIGTAWQLFLTAMVVSLATLAESRILRALLHFVTLGLLFWGFTTGLSGAFAVLEKGAQIFTDITTSIALIAGFWMILTWGVLLYESAAARMSLPTEDYAKGPRLAFIVQSLGGILLFLWAIKGSSEAELPAVASIVTCLHLAVVGVFVASDRDGMSKALRLKKGFSLLKPGGLRGYWLVMLMLVAAGGLFTGFAVSVDSKVLLAIGAPLYAILYVSMAVAGARLLRHAAFQTAAIVRVLFVILVVLGSGFPPLFAAIIDKDATNALINTFNPVVGLINLGEGKGEPMGQLAIVALVALGLMVLSHLTLKRRDGDLSEVHQ